MMIIFYDDNIIVIILKSISFKQECLVSKKIGQEENLFYFARQFDFYLS